MYLLIFTTILAIIIGIEWNYELFIISHIKKNILYLIVCEIIPFILNISILLFVIFILLFVIIKVILNITFKDIEFSLQKIIDDGTIYETIDTLKYTNLIKTPTKNKYFSLRINNLSKILTISCNKTIKDFKITLELQGIKVKPNFKNIQNKYIYLIKYNGLFQIESINKCDDIYYDNLNKFFNKDISNIILNYMFKY
jgi:hypothetical protein